MDSLEDRCPACMRRTTPAHTCVVIPWDRDSFNAGVLTERERCAKVAIDLQPDGDILHWGRCYGHGKRIAAAIRKGSDDA